MKTALQLQLWMTAALIAATDRMCAAINADSTDDRDRGDVPGWVMITVMTAAVVIALLTVFKGEVINAVQNAFNTVSGAGKG